MGDLTYTLAFLIILMLCINPNIPRKSKVSPGGSDGGEGGRGERDGQRRLSLVSVGAMAAV